MQEATCNEGSQIQINDKSSGAQMGQYGLLHRLIQHVLGKANLRICRAYTKNPGGSQKVSCA